MFVIDLDCQSTKIGFCEKVKRNLNITGQTITKAINLKVPIVVKITLKPLGEVTIGQAEPSGLIGLKSRDGIVRLYPQALVKQFQLKKHPEFLPADIIAEFNSDFNFWFEGDATPIKSTHTVNATELVPYVSIDDSNVLLLPTPPPHLKLQHHKIYQ
nr:7011_t:CDS:2 [Entrophospora candida]